MVESPHPQAEPCQAQRSGPTDRERCPEPARFVIHRHLDSQLVVCDGHLGPVILHAPNVYWPPQISLVDANEHPEHAVVTGADSDQREQRAKDWADRLLEEDPAPASSPALDLTNPEDANHLVATVLAVSPRRRSNEVLGALLGAVEAQLAAKGPKSVPAVLRGYGAANKMVNGGEDWATVLHLRQARTAAEIGHVLDSDIGHTAEGAAHIVSGLLRLAAAVNGLQVKGPAGAVPVQTMYQQTKKVVAQVRQAMDQDVRGELARAGHRV